MTFILAPTARAAEMWAAEHGVRQWVPLDAPFRLLGYKGYGAEVIVLDGGGIRYDRDALLTTARERGIPVRHDRSAAVA